MPAPIFFRQSTASDLGAMAKRVGAKHLMLTHLGPSLGAVIHNRWKVPGGPLTQADYRKAVEAGGVSRKNIVGTHLAAPRLPAKKKKLSFFTNGINTQQHRFLPLRRGLTA